MAKIDDFGGIPADTLSSITDLFFPTLAAGISKEVAIEALFHLAREEHSALHPGAGQAGFMDVFLAFEELKAALKEVQKATTGKDAKVKVLAQKLHDLAVLWQIGPVAPGFFTTKP